MTFINTRLPTDVETNARRIEDELIDVVRTDGGYEVRNARHSQALYSYEIDFGPRDYDEETQADVYEMWRASRGGLYAFRFRDWDTKNSTLTDEVIGTGDGSDTTFQITQTFTVGGVSAVRNITRPVSAFVVKVNDVTKATPGDYSINYDTGLVTFTSPPANGHSIKVSGVFDIPVRFDLQIAARGLFSHLEQYETIRLVEVKE